MIGEMLSRKILKKGEDKDMQEFNDSGSPVETTKKVNHLEEINSNISCLCVFHLIQTIVIVWAFVYWFFWLN